jgi:predicted RNase H-like nuclease
MAGMRTVRLPALIEVYPHPALLELLASERRLLYKVAKRSAYWPEAGPADRVANLLDRWKQILEALAAIFGPIPIAPPTTTSPSKLKHYEDMLDALVCAWGRGGVRARAGHGVWRRDRGDLVS